MDDDIDFDDLLGEQRAEELRTQQPVFDASAAPSENELRLGRKVLALEKERDAMAAELDTLRLKQTPSVSAPVTSPETVLDSNGPVTIPHELLPTLALLQQHIQDLSRDNAALRYTLLGEPLSAPGQVPAISSAPVIANAAGIAGSSPIIPHLDQASIFEAQSPAAVQLAVPTSDGNAIAGGLQGVDVDKVLARVKALMLENQELGAMVLEAGRSGGERSEWEKALEESKAVIESLDTDLSHHLATIQALRAELQTYKTQAPAPPTGPSRSAATHHKAPSISTVAGGSQSSRVGSAQGSSSSRPSSHRDRGHDRDRDRDRDRARDGDRERPRERLQDQPPGHSHGSPAAAPTPKYPPSTNHSGLSGRIGSPASAAQGFGGGGSGGSRGRVVKHQQSNSDAASKDKDPPRGPREDRDVKRRR